jgi:hypothetical protein
MLNWESSEEGWRSLYQLAETRQRSGIEWSKVLDYCRRAHQSKRDRAEALYQVGVYYRSQKLYHLAYVFLKQAMGLPRPTQTAGMFYEYTLPMEYARCCVEVGEHARAIEVSNSLLYGGKIPADLADKVFKSRERSLEELYPKVPQPAAIANTIKLCIIFNNPGPLLENCVESVVNQEYENFEIIFIDDASTDGSYARVPQNDNRITFIRNNTRRGFSECLRQCANQHCDPEDVIFPLDGTSCLAYCDALVTVNEFFNSYDCSVMYGQNRYFSGQLGLAVPLTSSEYLIVLREAGHRPSPFVFRCRLYSELMERMNQNSEAPAGESEESALCYALLDQCGLSQARFSDHILTIVNTGS